MSSPLDLTGNANDDRSPKSRVQLNATKGRRAKRHVKVEDRLFTSQESNDITTSTPRVIVNYLGDFVFVILFNVIMIFFHAIARGFSRVFGGATSVGNYLSHAEENQILETMPAEQKQQRRELEYIHDCQVQQNRNLDDLRRRVQRLEERRKARAKQS